MLELMTPPAEDCEIPVGHADNSPQACRRGLRRRPAARVVVMSSVIVITVWAMRYAGAVGGLFWEAAAKGQGRPWGQIFHPFFVAGACPKALLFSLAAVVGFYLYLRRKAVRPLECLILEALSEPVEPAPAPARSWLWIVLGLATVAAALCIVEAVEPFYFVQDDNFSAVLPVLTQSCRSIFQGEFPDFDPYQLMGGPGAGAALLYLPTVASYAVARWGLGNENFTLEVFAALHLLLGYLASFAAARLIGLRPALAFVLAISFVLSGYILLVGRGWFMVLTLVFWLPAMFCCMEYWLQGRANARWLLAASLTIGGFYYTGFPQFWFYAMLFMALVAGLAVSCGRIAVRQLVWPMAASLFGLALIMPTLIVQLALTRGMVEKEANFGIGIEQGLLATIVPYPFSHAAGFMPLPANRDRDLETQWYYAGTFLMACAYLSLGALLCYRCRRTWLGQHPWTVAAIIALWLGLGKEGLLWTLVGNLPVLRAVNHHPHRLLPFFVFFGLIVGGLFAERLLRRTASRKWEYFIAAATAGLMLYHASLSRNSLWCYGDRPYPELPQDIARSILPSQNRDAGRVLSFVPWRSGLPGYAYGLPMNLPSAYGAYGFGGYNPVTEARPESLKIQERFAATPSEAAQAYGIRWVLAANAEYFKQESGYWRSVRDNDWCYEFSDTAWPQFRQQSLPAAELRFRNEEVSLYELPDASPLAFDRAHPRSPLPIRLSGSGAEVEAPGNGPRTVVVNLAMRPWLRAASGSQPLEYAADAWGRTEVRLPDGVSHFEVYYDLPWRKGIWMGLGLAATTFAGLVLLFGSRAQRIVTRSGSESGNSLPR
jgi:hypothetical protein